MLGRSGGSEKKINANTRLVNARSECRYIAQSTDNTRQKYVRGTAGTNHCPLYLGQWTNATETRRSSAEDAKIPPRRSPLPVKRQTAFHTEALRISGWQVPPRHPSISIAVCMFTSSPSGKDEVFSESSRGTRRR
jgi:hypothetical protein